MENYDSKIKTDIDDEVIAVITAAVVALQTRPGYKLVVRSMKHASPNSPSWNIAGRLETMRSNLNS